MIGTREENARLIAACNLLCDFVGRHLPDGWEIDLSMSRDEACCELIDPRGHHGGGEFCDSGHSQVDAMCEYAISEEAQRLLHESCHPHQWHSGRCLKCGAIFKATDQYP